MDDTTQEVVEENNQPAPTDETTLAEQPSNEEVAEDEQAVDEPSQVIDEPSDEPTDTEEQREVKRSPRAERRFDQMSKKLAEANQRAQPSAAQYLPNQMPRIEPGTEYSAEELDNILTQKAQAMTQMGNAQLVNQLQVRDTVQQYVNSVTEDTAELRKLPLLDPSQNGEDAARLEEKIGILYERANPIEKNGEFNPDFDPSYRLKDFALDYLEEVGRYRTKGQVESKQDLQSAADSAVIPPSGGFDNTPDDSTEALREKLADYKF